MKKLSLVMAAAMCMTVGGVYATWSYATGAITDTATGSRFANLAGLGTASAKGDIVVKVNETTLSIDQDTTAVVSHTAKLVYNDVDPVVTFTPAVGASVSGIAMTITISESYGTYTMRDGTEVDLFTILDAEGNASGNSFTFNVEATRDDKAETAGQQIVIELDKYLQLNTLVLPTLEDYNHFKTWVSGEGKEIVITVTETAAP